MKKALLLIASIAFINQASHASFSDAYTQELPAVHRTFSYENVNKESFQEQLRKEPQTNSVTLDECEVDLSALISLHECFPTLHSLTLSNVNLSDRDLAPLHPQNDPSQQVFSCLKNLDISHNSLLSHEGIECLRGRSFVSLDLSHNNGVDDRIFDALTTLPFLSSLNLSGLNLSEERAHAFKRTHPEITIQF